MSWPCEPADHTPHSDPLCRLEPQQTHKKGGTEAETHFEDTYHYLRGLRQAYATSAERTEADSPHGGVLVILLHPFGGKVFCHVCKMRHTICTCFANKSNNSRQNHGQREHRSNE